MSSALLRVQNIGGRHQLEIQQAVYSLRQYTEPVNMVSIFGAPRGGKSWLMGELSSTPGCFDTRPGNARSCTSGIDICDRIVSLREYMGNGPSLNGSSSGRIAHVDCEGKGANDNDYDTVLFCPILLVSRVMMLNWKGGLQKSGMMKPNTSFHLTFTDILDFLQALITIAQRFMSSSLKLGHLYFVLRDADELDTPSVVYSELFDEDNDATLNLYRRNIRNTFESVQVFCLPPPSDRRTMSQSGFHLNACDLEFQSAFAALRRKLIQDVSTPRNVHTQPLTGPFIVATIESTVNALNDGAANVFPRSVAQALVNNIITEELNVVEERIDSVRDSQPVIADPNSIAAALQQELDDCMTYLQQRLGHYNEECTVSKIATFHTTQVARNTVAFQNIKQNTIEVLTDCYRRAVVGPINALQHQVAEEGDASSVAVASLCDACKHTCLRAFDQESAARGIGASWEIMHSRRAYVSNEIDGMLNTLRLGHARLTSHSSIFARISSFIYRRRFDVDLLPAIMACRLDDNSVINDAQHRVLRTVDTLQILPMPPVDRMPELIVAVGLEMKRTDQNRSAPNSRRARVLRKGLDAVLDQEFLNITQQCDTVQVSVRSAVLRVWEVVRVHVDKSEMLLRLCEELYDSRPAGYDVGSIFISDVCRFHNCPGGIVARILNTLKGFCNVPGHPIDPSLREGFLWAFSHRVLRHATLEERLSEATTILDEYGIIEDRSAWLDGVRERGDIENVALTDPLIEVPEE